MKDRLKTFTEFLTLDNLGDKRGSDIFGKYSMCFTPVAMYEYIPAIPCTSPDHHTDPSQCDCGTAGHNCTPPTPAGYEFLYYMGTFDCTSGSSGNTGSDGNTTGGNHGTGGGTTLPVGLGINGFDPSIFDLDPCDRTKSMLQDPKVQQAIDDVTVQAKKAALDVNEGEIGRIEKNGNFYPADVSEDHHVIFNDISGAKGAYHSHTYNGAKIHSPEDIFSILGFAQVQPTVSNYGDAYIGMIGAEKCYPDVSGCFRMFHYIIRFSGTSSDLGINFTEDKMKKFNKDYRDREHELAETLPYVNFLGDITLNKKGYEKLFFETLHNMGLSGKVILQRVDDDGTVNNINLDANGIPAAIPCPQL